MGRNKVKVGGREIVLKTSKVPKGAPRSKRPGANDTPARRKYWTSKVLETRKIKNLMKFCGLTRAEAYIRWHDTRKGRMR